MAEIGAGEVAAFLELEDESRRLTASPPLPVPPLVKALREVREMLSRAVREQDLRELEVAIERINAALDQMD